MTCEQWQERLSEYLDRGLGPEAHHAVEAHVAECADCAQAFHELRRVVARGAAMEDRPASVDLWPGIAERIGARVPARPMAAGRRAWLPRGRVPQLLAASVVLVATVGLGMRLGSGEPESGVIDGIAVPTVIPAALVEPVASPYDQAIGDLSVLLRERRDVLRPETVRIIEQNLAVIDAALERARQALEADPQSGYLQQHLDRTKRQKLDLLRRVTAAAI